MGYTLTDIILKEKWYQLSTRQVLTLLKTSVETGLDASEIEQRHNSFGYNELTRQNKKGIVWRFLLQFNQALVYILLVAVVINLFLGAWVDAAVIFGVVLLNSIIGFTQEDKALSALEALSKALTTRAYVIRDGIKKRINATDLVPGDIVFLASGDKVPADLRLVECRNLQVDESALTGESVPVEKNAHVLVEHLSQADRTNMCYSSTLVTYGTATGVVTATGDNTEIGHISSLISSTEILATPLTRKINHFSHLLLYVIIGLALLTFLVGLWHGESWYNLFMAAIALSVAMIPEGLPAVLTITLAIGVARMAKRHAIIRHLPAVETLGSTTVICSDKTGTLTQNKMTVQQAWCDEVIYSLDQVKHEINNNYALRELFRAGMMCNDAVLIKDKSGFSAEGDPTEGALLISAHEAGLDIQKEQGTSPRLDTIPFESQYQYMATLHESKPAVIYLKGSVESVLECCKFIMDCNGLTRPVNKQDIHRQVNNMAVQGQRVLAFAYRYADSGVNAIAHTDMKDMIFIGLQAMLDPPRKEAIVAVKACQNAGIRVKMITGDHVITAMAIATEMGIAKDQNRQGPAKTLTGQQLQAMSEEQIIQSVTDTHVFARVSPEQKLHLVQALQEGGNVVAMTGDGVNDAPALRSADIGIAMGIAGTEVSREAADMILTNDNFATIEAAIEEGRGVFDNLLKFLTWIMPTNAGQGLVIIVAVMLASPLPVLPVQALWINMTTAVLLGLALAFEPREPGIMARPPRHPETVLLNSELVFRIVLVGFLLLLGSFGLFEWSRSQGASLNEARTIAVNVFAVGQSFYLLNCRSLRYSMFQLGVFSNPWIWVGIGAMFIVQLLFTYLPIMNQLFHTAPIGLTDWLLIILTGLFIYLVIGAEKTIRQYYEKIEASNRF